MLKAVNSSLILIARKGKMSVAKLHEFRAGFEKYITQEGDGAKLGKLIAKVRNLGTTIAVDPIGESCGIPVTSSPLSFLQAVYPVGLRFYW
jgi:hypothetical protein